MARRRRPETRPEPDLRRLVRRARWTSREARSVLEAQGRSDLSLTAFARRWGLSTQRLELWRKRLAGSSATAAAAPQRFLPVRVVGPVVEPAPIEVVLRSGHRLQLRHGFDPVVLARVVEVLEHGAC